MDQDKASRYAKIIATGLVIVAAVYFGIKAINTRVSTSALKANYSISIPTDWSGSYEKQQTDTVTTVWYTKDPGQRAVIFEIRAYTPDQWSAIKSKGTTANEILVKEDAVFVYDVPNTNPYQGESSFRYELMKKSVPSFIQTFKLTN